MTRIRNEVARQPICTFNAIAQAARDAQHANVCSCICRRRRRRRRTDDDDGKRKNLSTLCGRRLVPECGCGVVVVVVVVVRVDDIGAEQDTNSLFAKLYD